MKNTFKKFAAMSLVFAFLLSACSEEKQTVSTTRKATDIATNETRVYSEEIEQKDIAKIHEVEFNGQTFEIETTYAIEKEFVDNWLYTIPNQIDLQVKTNNLPENLEVVVNNVYSDITLSSKKARFNGLRQDSLNINYSSLNNDGFSINNTNPYILPFQVEGVNQTETFVRMFSGYANTTYSYLDEEEVRYYSDGVLLNAVWTIGIKEKDTNKLYSYTVTDRIFIKSAPYK